MKENLYIAVDLGAGSGRVFLCLLAENEFLLEEIHRFGYPPRKEKNHLRWDFSKIFEEIKFGLKKAGERAGELGRTIESIGVDSWGVDYGLLDKSGNLMANPICYRDSRTEGVMEKVFEKISRAEIFEKTGIQFLNFNTVFQLFAEDETIEKADRLLLLPDLINYFLTGQAVAEYTNATTTQFLNAKTKNWDFDLLEKLGLPKEILPEIVEAGTGLGFLKAEIASESKLENVRVVVPATHDTGSAVIGAPLAGNQAFISSGTWSLVGIERHQPLINKDVARHNFTNEGGAFGTIRFLKNVMGLWIFESCRKEWKARGIDVGYENLLREVREIDDLQGFIFPDDERFLNPPSMLRAIAEQLQESEQVFNENPAMVCKVIFDSLAFRYAAILRTIEKLTAENLESIQIIGGGGRNEYLNQMTANASGLKVQAGLTEATVTGNALVQAISAGRFSSLSEARRYVKNNFSLKEFIPQRSSELEAAAKFYNEIEVWFAG
jgi:rhamnulokinase